MLQEHYFPKDRNVKIVQVITKPKKEHTTLKLSHEFKLNFEII